MYNKNKEKNNCFSDLSRIIKEVMMDINKENEKLIVFWDQQFKEVKPMTLSQEDFDLNVDFNRLLKHMGDHCEDILDIGCGYGYGLFAAKLLGSKMTYGLGIDPSEHAIDTIEETCFNSNIHGIDAKAETHDILSVFDDESFDGVICSNTLDVIPEQTSNEIIDLIKRLLKPEGLLLLKLNFYLTDALIDKIGMVEIEKNTYTINGIIRGVNHNTQEWIRKFDGFEVIEETEFERVPNGPKDRLLLLKKK